MLGRAAAESTDVKNTIRIKIGAVLSRLFSMARVRRRVRRLHVCETLSFGEKRFIAVVEYNQQKFLLGGTPQNISLLQRLDGPIGVPDCTSRPESSLP